MGSGTSAADRQGHCDFREITSRGKYGISRISQRGTSVSLLISTAEGAGHSRVL